MNRIDVKRLTKVFMLPRPNALAHASALLGIGFHQTVPALQNVSLEVKEGECVGIIGENGSGKSTFLKILAGIIKPTQGTVHIRGSFASFLEMGLGFEREFTGRENAYLYGSLIGIPKKDLRSQMDRIVAFAGLEQFIDHKLKYYSSGMQLRLAFSTALFADPDIFLIDEIFKVGDEFFQKRCLEEIKKKKGAKTFVFVSHDLGQIREICDRVILLHQGRVVESGGAQEVVDAYLLRVQKKEVFIARKELELEQREVEIQDQKRRLALQEEKLQREEERRQSPAKIKLGHKGSELIVQEPALLSQALKKEQELQRREQGFLEFAKKKEQELLSREEDITKFATRRQEELSGREQRLQEEKETREKDLARRMSLFQEFQRERERALEGREAELNRIIQEKQQAWQERENNLDRFQTELEEKSRELERNILHYLYTLKRHLPPHVTYQEGLAIIDVLLTDSAGKKCHTFRTGDPLTVTLRYEATRRIKKPTFGVSIFHFDGTRVAGPNSTSDRQSQDIAPGSGEVHYHIPTLPFLGGHYFISATIFDTSGDQCYDYKDKTLSFKVKDSAEEKFGFVKVPASWTYTILKANETAKKPAPSSSQARESSP